MKNPNAALPLTQDMINKQLKTNTTILQKTEEKQAHQSIKLFLPQVPFAFLSSFKITGPCA